MTERGSRQPGELENFVGKMDALVASERRPALIAERAAEHLRELLTHRDCLPAPCRIPDPRRYAQHIVHVHDEGLYSLVSLVWQSGQETPIHDHRCWCIVGVLEGTEQETRYQLRSDDHERWLVPTGTSYSPPGSVGVLVPPAENIHRVANAGGSQAISLHVYGADISACGSSINQIFDEPVRPLEDGQLTAWRP